MPSSFRGTTNFWGDAPREVSVQSPSQFELCPRCEINMKRVEAELCKICRREVDLNRGKAKSLVFKFNKWLKEKNNVE